MRLLKQRLLALLLVELSISAYFLGVYNFTRQVLPRSMIHLLSPPHTFSILIYQLLLLSCDNLVLNNSLSPAGDDVVLLFGDLFLHAECRFHVKYKALK